MNCGTQRVAARELVNGRVRIIAYFAPDAPDFQEAGKLKSADLTAAQRVLDVKGVLAERRVLAAADTVL